MAKNLSESGAFEVTDSRKPRLSSKGKNDKREIFQLNCLVSRDLKIPFAIARATEGRSAGDIIEPLLTEYLKKGGYLS